MATLPNPNPIPNTADVSFNYTIDPSIPNGGSGNNTSNQVRTQINIADLGNSGNFTKSVDKVFATVADQLIYTITTVNTGNATANGAVISDTIPNDTTFVPGSAIINGIPSGISPIGGLLTAPVGNVAPGATASISFRVTINTIPNPNPIPDNARVTFTFTIDPSVPNGGSGDNLSNTVFTQVNYANLGGGSGIVKTVDTGCAAVGDNLTYIITATNTGNVTANNITLIDTLPNPTDANYIPGTLLVNGVPNGFPIGGIIFIGLPAVGPGATTSVQYQLHVNQIPTPNPILDQARMSYRYTINPITTESVAKNDLSNIVLTTISQASFVGGMVKSSDKQNVQIGEQITYTVNATNTGNTIANNASIADTIPNNTTFVPGSVVINGIPSGASPVANVLNLPVGNIDAGATASISFRVTATTIPTPNPIPNDATINFQYTVCPTVPNGASGSDKSNIVNVNVFEASFGGDGTTLGNNIIKTVDKTSATVGDQLLYIINATNTGNVTANNAIITDTIPNGTTFLPASAVVNGVSNPILVPIGGALSANVGNVAPGATASLAFRVVVTATLPNPNPIPDNARIDFTFTVDPTIPNGRNGEDISNTVFTQISAPNFGGPNGTSKTSDKGFVQIGEQVTYTLVAANSGNVTATNVVAVDTIPLNTTFVPGSVVINGIPSGIAPIANVLIAPMGTIAPNGSATVTFRVTVTTIPNPNPINNSFSISYNFTSDPSVPNGATGSSNSNILPVTVSQASFNGVGTTLGNNIIKTVDKTTAKVLDQLLYIITARNTGNVTADNSVIVDTIPNDTTFVPGSAVINGIPSGIAPVGNVLSAPVGNVAAGATASLAFRVTINTIPNPNPIPDSARIDYNFTVQPTLPDGRTGQDNTNTVFTQVNQATFGGGSGVVKTVDRTSAKFGDVLTYVITGTNTGNVTANNASIIDTIPNGTTFVPTSAIVNGLPNPILVPIAGVLTAPVGNVAPGATTSLSFRVTVSATVPNPNPIPDNARIDFTYTVSVPNDTNGSDLSNTVFTSVGQASFAGSITKSSDKTDVDIGEQITYVINATNSGNTTATSAVIVDTIPVNTTFVPGSVVINGVPSGISPVANVLSMPVGTIGPGSVASISFRVTATTIPTPNPIPNDGTINYQFVVGATLSNGSDKSNIVNVNVFEASFGGDGTTLGNNIIKSVDKTSAKVGDQLLYIITARNTGNTTANNAVISDTIPNDTTFVPASAVVNGIPNVILVPIGGVLSANVGNVAPNATVSLAFRVTINTIPNPNPIPDTAIISYTFTVNPTIPNGRNGANQSNTVNTQVNTANFGNSNKSSNKGFAQVGEQITYTITGTNTGNTTATNVTVVDTIPNGTTFLPASGVINNVPAPGLAPVGNVLTANMGNVAPNGTITLSFTVTVNTIPSPNPIQNSATINFNFTADPSVPNGASGSNATNTLPVTVNQANNNLVKTVDKVNANVSDQLIYIITATNTGNVTANNAIITDTIPNDTTFVPASAVINGVSNPILVPIGGALSGLVGNIAPGASASLAFRVSINTIPSPNPIPDNARINYQFTVAPTIPNGGSGANLSNTVFTQVNNANFGGGAGVVKTVDKTSAKVFDQLLYIITGTNTGNVTATNVVITDTIPSGTTFLPASAVVNGVSNPILVPIGGALSANMGNVAPGATISLAFRVTITTSIPNPNPIPDNARIDFTFTVTPTLPNGQTGQNISNTVFTAVGQASFAGSIVKSSDKQNVEVGEQITYTIVATNSGNSTAINAVVVDTIPVNTAFVPLSVVINGVPSGIAPVANVLSMPVGNIGPGAVATVSFKVTATTIPTPNPIPNDSTINYQFAVGPTISNGSDKSNIVNVNVFEASFGNTLIKTVDKAFAAVGDQLIYIITATNSGNATANNSVITDTIPNDTTFVPASAVVNGVPNVILVPIGGALSANVGSIAPGASASLAFRVSINTLPNPNPIPDQARINYTFTVNVTLPNAASGENLSNTVFTQVNSPNFNGNGTVAGLIKTADKAFVELGDIVTYTIIAKNGGNATATNAVMVDTIPTTTSFVPASAVVNNVPAPGLAPVGNILTAPVGNIAPGATATLSFQVVVNTIPGPGNTIPNDVVLNYNFTADPAVPNGESASAESNLVLVAVAQGGFDGGGTTLGNNFIKTVDKTSANVGDQLLYTITGTNTGNTTVNNTIITDTIPNDTTFVAGSAVVNGVSNPILVPIGGALSANVGSVGPGATISLAFRVTINTLPNPNPIPDNARINFTFTVDPLVPNGASGENLSNTVFTQVNIAQFSTIAKTVDKAYADVSDILTYVITATNNGNITAIGAVIIDTIPNDTTFVPASAVVNGIPNPILVPIGGALSAPVGNVGPGATVSLAFKVSINTIPNPNPIPDNAIIDFVYIPNTARIPGQNISNTVFTQVNTASFANNNKSADKGFAQLGEIVTYNISATNTGNTTALNVVVVDTIPLNTTFVPNSVLVNGIPSGIAPIANVLNILVGSVNPGASVTISFRATVTTIPTPNPINNSATINFNYTVDPLIPGGKSGSDGTNIVPVTVSEARYTVVKTVDKAFAKIGDQLIYIITTTNTGNTTANSTVIVDTIPNDTTFVPLSGVVNGVAAPGLVPIGGAVSANVGNIGPGASASLAFRVSINTIPNPNPIPDNAVVNFQFTVQPTIPNGRNGSTISNTVFTQVNQAIFGTIPKTADKGNANVGDTITYTITAKNNGNVTATNVTVVDTIPAATAFVPASAIVNNVPNPGLAPIAGVLTANMGNVAPGATTTLVFKVTVTTVPNPNPINNNATINFNYTIDPSVPNGGSGSNGSSTVPVTVSNANINLIKSVDKTNANVGDIITYTINAINNGNTTTNNSVITDTIPNDTTFVPASAVVNGVPNPGLVPIGGAVSALVGSIAPGAAASLLFRVSINTIPNPNPIPDNARIDFQFTVDPTIPNGRSGENQSNTVFTQVNNANFGIIRKTVDKAFADVSDQLLYIITATNTGNITANNATITDTIPNDTTFVPASAVVNGISNPILVPIGGAISANVGNVAPGATVSLAFRVSINTIPNPNPIPDNARINFIYIPDPLNPNGVPGQNITNTVFTQVNTASLGNAHKSTDKGYAQVGEVITYTINATNTGNTTALNIVIVDTIPQNTTFVPNSVVVNGVPSGIAPVANVLNIPVGQVAPNASLTVSFRVTVVSIPNPNPINNNATISFNYTVTPTIPGGKPGSSSTNIVPVTVSQARYTVVKTVDKAFAEVADQLLYIITTTNTGNATANNTVIVDTIPNDTTFVPASAVVNGIPNAILVPIGGAVSANVGNIAPGASASLAFRVSINTIPNPNPIPDNAVVNFQFTVQPTLPNGRNGSNISNTVFTKVNDANLDSNHKSSDKGFADVGEVITFTITAKNTGNVTATNVSVVDTLPNGTTFVPASVVINGVINPGIAPVGNLLTIPVPPVAPNATTTIAFKVTVTSIPNPNPISNSATITFNFTVDPSIPNGGGDSTGTNTIPVTIANANFIVFTKTPSDTSIGAGGTITYTLVAQNTGNVNATNVVITDTIPNGTTFVPASAVVNNIPNPALAPIGNILTANMGTVAPGGLATLTFQINVISIPNPNPIDNSGIINFNFIVDPSQPPRSGSNQSTHAITQVTSAILAVVKDTSLDFADLGDVTTYTITIVNNGNTLAHNVLLTDAIQVESSFVPTTVKINNVPNPAADPNAGIPLSPILPGVPTVVTFNVSIDAIPFNSRIFNTATVAYSYTIPADILPLGISLFAPFDIGVDSIATSNTTVIIVQHAEVDSVKSADKAVTAKGDTITYTLVSTNNGNVTANNVIVSDPLTGGLSFVPGSVTVNAIPRPLDNIVIGVNVGNLAPGAVATTTFKALVTTTDTVVNQSLANFNYIVDPNSLPKNVTIPSNTVTIVNNSPNLLITKTPNTSGVILGDNIRYTITALNNGKLDLTNVIVTDTLSSSLLYQDNLTVNGVLVPGADITTGVNIGNLTIGSSSTVAFDVKVVTIPANGQILNHASGTFNYQIVPGGPILSGNSNIFTSTVTGFNASVEFDKTNNKQVIKIGDTFNYTILVTNNGNITISNSVLTDTLPTGFVVQQITVDGVITPGDISLGLPLGPIGINQTKTVVLTVLATTIPNPNPFINVAVGSFEVVPDPNRPPSTFTATATDTGITVKNPELTLTKGSDSPIAVVGAIVTYTITVANTGDVILEDVLVSDMLAPELEFVSGSVTVNNISDPLASIISGVPLGTMNIGDVRVIKFQAKVLSKPESGLISNQSIGQYDFRLAPGFPLQPGSNVSNVYTIAVLIADLRVIKTTESKIVSIGDTITYNVMLINDGDVDLTNVLFKDDLPPNVSLIDGSFTINGAVVNNVNLEQGVVIPVIPAHTITTISYKVTVLSSICNSKIINSASASFRFTLPNGATGNGQSDVTSDSVTVVDVTLSNFKQFSVEEYLEIPRRKPDIETINAVKGSVSILRSHVIPTATASSNEGQKVTQYKLIVHGIVNLTAEYTACEAVQGAHSAHYSIPFSTFVVLPTNFVPGSNIDIDGMIEDIYYNDLDCRIFFTNTTIFLNVQILNC